MVKRSTVLRVTGFLWRFQAFRLLVVACACRGWFQRAIGLYTPFWWALRVRFNDAGEVALASNYGEVERRYERLARVAGL